MFVRVVEQFLPSETEVEPEPARQGHRRADARIPVEAATGTSPNTD
jgi:hypothetical protein